MFNIRNLSPSLYGVFHGVMSFLLFALPLVIHFMPQAWMNMTVGGILVGLLNWIEANVAAGFGNSVGVVGGEGGRTGGGGSL